MATQPVAACLVRTEPAFRRKAYVAGLKRLGFKVTDTPDLRPARQDVCVVWNRHGYSDFIAQRYEESGAKAIVTENGYVGTGAVEGYKLYALARGHHNGAGRWPVSEGDRWSQFGIELQPWRTDGEHILVLPQRGIGPSGIAQPRGWADDMARGLRRMTKRPVVLRKHPGTDPRPLGPDLRGCWAAVTWGSGAAIKAIVAGIPVFYGFPRWIGASAAVHGLGDIEAPFLGDRLPMLQRLAWSQFSIAELETGEPFARMLAI